MLWQQGNDICQQPLESNKSILLYNGDLFMSNRIYEGESDTKWLHTQLDSCATMDEMIELFTTLKGPYSIIYLNKRNQKLHIIRDSLGRNSLLLGKLNDLIVISSVLSCKFCWFHLSFSYFNSTMRFQRIILQESK